MMIVALALDEADSAMPIRDMGVGEGLEEVALSGDEVEWFDGLHSGEEEGEGFDPEWTCSRPVDCEDRGEEERRDSQRMRGRGRGRERGRGRGRGREEGEEGGGGEGGGGKVEVHTQTDKPQAE